MGATINRLILCSKRGPEILFLNATDAEMELPPKWKVIRTTIRGQLARGKECVKVGKGYRWERERSCEV